MKKFVFIILLFTTFQSFGQNRFPSIDSAKNYTLRYYRNSTVETFTNLRGQNIAYGTLQLLDSLAGNGVIDSIWKVSGGGVDTLKYRISNLIVTVGTFSGGGGAADSSIFATRYYIGQNFVPYTGAINDVDLGAFNFAARSINVTGTGGGGFIHLRHQSSLPNATGQSTAIYADNDGNIGYKNDGFSRVTFNTRFNTADRIYRFQNKSYTVADSADVALKLNISDTASMLSPYLRSNVAAATYVPQTRTITINGTAQDLSANRSWTVSSNPTSGTYATMQAISSPVDGQLFSCTDYLPGLWSYSSFNGQWQYTKFPLITFAFNHLSSNGYANMVESFTGTGATASDAVQDLIGHTRRYITGTATNGFSGFRFDAFGSGRGGILDASSPANTAIKFAYKVRVKLNQLSNGTNRFVAILGSINTSNARLMCFTYRDDQSSGNWQAVAVNNLGQTTVNTGVAANTDWNEFLVLGSSTEIKYYINGVLVATITTNNPIASSNVTSLAAVNGTGIQKLAGTTAVSMDVSVFKIWNFNND